VVSENWNKESAVPQDQEHESSLLQHDQSITGEKHDDLEQPNPGVEVLPLSENTTVDNKCIKNGSLALILTKKMMKYSHSVVMELYRSSSFT
jgi:hypothetical protein